MTRTLTRALLLGSILFCLSPLIAQHQRAVTAVSRAQILLTPENMDRIPLMEIDLTHGQLIPGKYFTTDLTAREIEHIRSLGFQVDILIEDVTMHYQSQAAQRSPLSCQEYHYDYAVPKNFEFGSMGGYLTYSEILDALDLMQFLYPALITIRTGAGDEVTHQGRPIFWVRMSDNANQDEPEPEVLYTGLHHAREPMSMMQMMYFMWHLLEGYGKDPEATYLLNNTELYFMPCVNPDGYIYNQQIAPGGGGMWRKNMRDNDENGEFDESEDGVDINRNYGYQWGVDELGSSSNPSSQVYRGPSAFSEPETRAIKEFVAAHNIIFALNYHAYGNYFLYPWGYTEEHNPDLTKFKNYGELMALDNGFKHGTAQETVGYPTNGASDDWMYAEHDIFAMTPELGDGDYGFWPSADQIIPLSQASLRNNLALAHLPHQFAVATEMNGPFFTDRSGTVDITIKSYGDEFSDMALTILSLSPELDIDANIVEVSMETFEAHSYSLAYSVEPSAVGGDEFSFILKLDNGYFEVRDTITKTLAGETIAFFEDGEDLEDWTSAGTDWNITYETAYSGETCIADSPGGDYAPDTESILEITDAIDLRDAVHAVLEFWTKWEIEEYIDYAQVQISTDGEHYDALCGEHSKLGSIFQLPQPIYDGVQEEWVKESIDLSPYIGNLVYIRFVLVTDSYFNQDGIYLDDIRVYVYDEDITAIGDPENSEQELRVWPNPSDGHLWIATEVQGSMISVMDMLGREVYRFQSTREAHNLNTCNLPAGLYYINLYVDGRIADARKVIVE